MQWATAITEDTEAASACDATVARIQAELKGTGPDLVLVFASFQSDGDWATIAERFSTAWPDATVLGCSATGVVGGGREVEGQQAISVTAAVLPDVGVLGFHHGEEAPATVEEAVSWWHTHLGIEPDHDPSFILLPEPFSSNPGDLVGGLDRAYPGQVKIGGLASGGQGPGEHRLLLDDKVHNKGTVGVALYGDIEVSTVVAQGCRPIGDPLVVTGCQQNTLIELGGAPALLQLDMIFRDLNEADQALFRAMPMIGIGMKSDQTVYRQGDFLIRHLMGMDRERGVLAVGAMLEPGQVIQFHVRDAASSRMDLEEMLQHHGRSQALNDVAGALLFSCVGRGERFFGVADHDSDLFATAAGGVPLGGFFCAGEIGPVHGQTWLHGYTSAFGVFRPRGWD